MRATRILLLAAIVFAVCYGAAPSSAAPAVKARLAAATTVTRTWKTCVPQALRYTGEYIADNDQFTGSRGKLCIESRTGHDYTVTTSMPASPTGHVVAYPGIRVGQYWNAADPASGLAAPSMRLGHLHLTLHSDCKAGGVWQQDIDAMFSATAAGAVRGAHDYELVVITCTAYGALRHCAGRIMHIQHRAWCAVAPWPTGSAGDRHLIMELQAMQPVRVYSATLGAFVAHVRQAGWLPRTQWLDYFAWGSEIWSGGRGLTGSMTLRWTGLPVISYPGGAS